MSYEALRHFADSYGLLFMTLAFLAIVFWTFRRKARKHHERAARSIFDDEERLDG